MNRLTGPGLRNTTILLVGLGNPIMGDDSVGIHVVRTLRDKIRDQHQLEFKELSLGGIRLVEEILGYETVIIIDSIETDETPGRIRELSMEQLKATEYSSSPHTTNFATALELYKRLEVAKVPSTIKIFAVDINPEFTFRESLSPPVQKAVLELAELVGSQIEQLRN